ncbi:DUF1654 domain-containing protein [Pseudomonas sp. 14P_5.3_Bac1]|uniref:DUF1654 domain-containing protein n=1 Tax=Pseudomonas sp. 14P_5.3_Bac1 TaxID=2971622 RepID=UPI0021C66ED3|nr:DUF1654 domain-containing protein [Pseudomonas sp. 14P_5.3_Bac1]MCU1780893.1 DUF1654 domain-containing protein [Pseudomonas sp. 14P_5.3_Bac1]
MAKGKRSTTPERQEMTAVEMLSLRVAAMINSPRAQERCSALIHRLDSDRDAEWDEIMSQISETDGVTMIFQDDGGVLIEWDAPNDDDRVLDIAEVEPIENEVIS